MAPCDVGFQTHKESEGCDEGAIMVVDLEKKNNKNKTKILIGNHRYGTEGSRLLILESPWLTPWLHRTVKGWILS